VTARYRSGTMESQALKNALRIRAMRKMYGTPKGGFGDLRAPQRDKVLDQVQRQYRHLRDTQGTLGPGLLDLFRGQRKTLRQRANTPPVTNNPGGGNGGGNGNNPQPPAPPINPYIQINSNGQLDLPYNQQFAGYLLDAKDQFNSQLLGLQQGQQMQDLDFTRAKRDADIDYQEAARQALTQNASRGLAFSSAYGKDVADNATNYNNYMSDLTQSDALYDQSVAAQRSGIETTFNDMLRRYALQQAEEAAKDAGNLGYGKPNKNNPIKGPGPKSGGGNKGGGNKPKPKPKPKGTWAKKHNRAGRIGPQGNLQKPARKLPPGKRWVPIKNGKGKVVRWKVVSTKAGK
jgi:hypothetical protein